MSLLRYDDAAYNLVMQEVSVTEANLPDLLAAVARGESVRLVQEGREVAVVTPSEVRDDDGPGKIDRSPGWMMRLRDKYLLDKCGFTKEEIDSWRDRSPGREPPAFE